MKNRNKAIIQFEKEYAILSLISKADEKKVFEFVTTNIDIESQQKFELTFRLRTTSLNPDDDEIKKQLNQDSFFNVLNML